MLKRLATLLTGGASKDSLFFDKQYYLSAHPDVAAAGIDPYDHFMNHGWREGRNPSGDFHSLYYRVRNRSYVKLENPLLHYQANKDSEDLHTFPESDEELRELEKRVLAAHFDERFYRSRYLGGDQRADALDHYLRVGWREGFDPRADFSTRDHLKAHPFIQSLKVSPFFHFLVVEAQGRGSFALAKTAPVMEVDEKVVVETVAAEFDAGFYLKVNPDVRQAKVDPLLHFVEYGWREGRDPNALFWTSYYLSHNDDVRAAGINPLYHFIVYGREEGREPNPIGDSVWPAPVAPTQEEWSAVASAKGVAAAAVDVVVPVYKGLSDTLACIHAVLANVQVTSFNLVVVNDCSPEPPLTAELRRLHALGLFEYLENEKNLGFVGTVNRALALHPDRDVILLNSDAIVHGDWIDRLLAHARRDETVATITPFSNNATICSYPSPNQNNILALETSLSELDDCAKVCNEGLATIVPTGVGFCMYMRRSIMDRIGVLDEETFGRGYGEENDYCLRAVKAGFKNLFAHDVFVYHTGQISFAEFAAAAVSQGQVELTRKHPDYPIRVQLYISADPARGARLRLDLYRMARGLGSKTAVMVTHGLGGGISTHIDHLAKRLREEGFKILTMVVGAHDHDDVELATDEDDVSIYTPSLGRLSISKQHGLIVDFIRWLRPEIFHVHSLVGIDWAPTLLLMSAIEEAAPDFYCTLHDFTPLCHRNHLVTAQGEFCAERRAETCGGCARSEGFGPYVDPLERQARYGAFLARAKRVFTPSDDAAQRYATVYPRVAFAVRPHEETLPEAFPYAPPEQDVLRVAIIGAIGLHKGSHVLHALAVDAERRKLPICFRIVGTSNIKGDLASVGVTETGRYRTPSEGLDLLDDWRPHIAFFPSVWPETFCYALSLALAAGIPPVVFDIGSPADRLKALRQGRVLPYELAADPSALNDALLALPVEELWSDRRPFQPIRYESMVEDYYGSPRVDERREALEAQSI